MLFVWTTKRQKSFEAIKKFTSLCIKCPSFGKPFHIQTDASDTGVETVLTQNIDGDEKVIEFASRTLQPAKINYTVTERECLAVIWAISRFRPYIEDSHFTVITDNSSLRWLCNLRNPTGRLSRFALELQGHDFKVEHRKDALNYVPEALSRMFERDSCLAISTVKKLPESHEDGTLTSSKKYPVNRPIFQGGR